jgi:DNA helicase-2/ATP-dependent DNA helicase PcrA
MPTQISAATSNPLLFSDDVFSKLNGPQRDAVFHEGGPLLVLAGAGSGKTRVLTHRVAWLIREREIDPGSILAVTFTNKAAGEMKERISALVGESGRKVWVGTFHSIGARLLRREALRLGVARDFSIFDRDDQIAAVRRVLADMNISPKETPPESVVAAISRAKNALQSPDEYEQEAFSYDRHIAAIYRAYQASLRRQSALDFDDLLTLPVELFRDEEVRLRYAARFKHVLVDEYQDTNRCQYAFLHAITQEHRQLFVVGDDDQSIYRWRGADLSNILDFEGDHPDARLIRLEQNYRSTGRILAAANSVIRHNVGRKGKELWTDRGEGDPVALYEVPDDQMEAMAVLRMVKAGIEEGRVSADDCVVLYRTNAQSRALENAFQLGGIQYQVVGGMRFYERREIKDVLAYLRVLVNPGDDVAMRRILNVPARGIGKKTLEDLEAFARATGISLLEAARRAGAGSSDLGRGNIRAKLAQLTALIERATARAAAVPVAEITKEILDEIGYREHLEREHEREATTRWDNVEELLNAMQEFAETEDRPDASAAAFLQEVSLTTDIDEYDEQARRVTLMTLHNAKGLEFPWVFLTGLEEGLFPHSNSAYEKEGLEEERRLFYVGLTRAKERVTLFTATARRRYGGMQHSMPSRFLDEIDPDLLERRAIVPEGRPARSMGTRFGSGEEWRGRTVRPSYDEGADDHPRYEEETQDTALAAGMRVLHPTWGDGIIETLEGRGENLKLTIRFRGGVRKKVLAVYAKLELLG